MQFKADVIDARTDKLPARGDFPARDDYKLVLRDATLPLNEALADSITFKLSDADCERFWGVLAGSDIQAPVAFIRLAATKGGSGPILATGRVLEVVDRNGGKPVLAKKQ